MGDPKMVVLKSENNRKKDYFIEGLKIWKQYENGLLNPKIIQY